MILDLTRLADKILTFLPRYFDLLAASSLVQLFSGDLIANLGNIDIGQVKPVPFLVY